MESKLLLIEQAKLCHTPVISCLATEGKLNPSRFEITDISRTGNVCPAAKKMRTELRKKGIRKVKVLYSRERCPKKVTEARNRRDSRRKHFLCAKCGGNADRRGGCQRYPDRKWKKG